MKELKAVEILKKKLDFIKSCQDNWDTGTKQYIEWGEKAEAIKEALAELQEPQEKSCVWTDENWVGNKRTPCGGLPYQTKYKFCPYCGDKIDYTPKG